MRTAQRHQWMRTVRFLFGLLSGESLDQMERGFHWSVSSDVKPAVEKWIKKEILGESVRISNDQLDWVHFLYETQDEEFMKSATAPLKEITIRERHLATRWNVTDFKALGFCLQNSLGLRRIDLFVNIEPEGLRALMPGLMKCCSLRMDGCSLTVSCCADLASVLKTNPSLTELDLSWNELGNSGVRELCEGLKHPQCTLRTLRLESNGLTDDVTRPLCLALRRNQSLQELELWGNDFTGRSVASFIKLKECVPNITTQILPTRCPAVDERYREEEDAYCYRVTFHGPGTFPCEKTGLCFEVGAAGTIEYKLLPWSNNLAQCGVQDLQIAGSLFDVTAEPGLVRAVYLPHFVCLRDGDLDESSLQIVHFGANGEMALEDPSEVQAFHVALRNPKFSPISVFWRSVRSLRKRPQIYGQALLYWAIHAADITLHLYLILDEAHIKKSLERDTDRKQKIDKPPQTEPLYFGRSYTAESPPSSEIVPEKLLFEHRNPNQEQPFIEIYRKDLPTEGVSIFLKDAEDSLVWKAVVREGDIDFKLKENRRAPDDIDSKLLETLRAPKPFITKHRRRLIERMGTIESIMDILQDARVLTDEEVECVVAEKTRSSRNRELIQMVTKKGTESMQEFLLALRKKDPLLYNDLEESK